MISKKRLMQIETALPPEQAVVLWLRQEFQGKTSQEYARWLIERPVTACPRIRVEREVVGAIQVAMKGQDLVRIHQAARQAKMEADFRILLVLQTNSVVRDQRETSWLRTGLLFTRLHAGLRDEDASLKLVADMREAAAELFSLKLAVERIQARYFVGECILATGVGESLKLPAMLLRSFLEGLDQEMEVDGHPELGINSAEFRSLVEDKASKKVIYIRALAKSEMLLDFGLLEAARAVLRPYVLGDE
jgi:hypothetical protein